MEIEDGGRRIERVRFLYSLIITREYKHIARAEQILGKCDKEYFKLIL